MQQVVLMVMKILKHNWWWVVVGAMVAGVLLPVMVWGGFELVYRGRVYPGVRVAGLRVNGFTEAEVRQAVAVLEKDYLVENRLSLEVRPSLEASEGAVLVFELEFDDLEVVYDPRGVAAAAYAWGRNKEVWDNLVEKWRGLNGEIFIEHGVRVNEEAFEELVAGVAAEVNRPGAPARVEWLKVPVESSLVEVFLGEDGWVMNEEEVKEKVKRALAQLSAGPVEVVLEEENNQVDEEAAALAKERALRLVDGELTVVLKDDGQKSEKMWVLGGEELVPWVKMRGGFAQEKIGEYVESLAEAVNREPQNALFKFENGRVLEFAPGLDGLQLVEGETVERMVDVLEAMEESGEDKIVELAVELTPPEIQTPEVNDLGIKELLGRGESTFYHSIAGRIHNVALTASRLNGVLVPPGEVFSFNKTIGDVSAATGYKSAYIIKDGRTILGDGGGVCQDSTTMFRAVMDAGLPILERQAHAYRVAYYEQNMDPGFDATVYDPHPDLKFRNDTPAHILIQTVADTDKLKLTIDLYGTSDGRKGEITNYQKWGYVPAPPPLYQDDPTLAPGVVKQVDWAASGLKVKFDYLVMRDGETLFEKTFYSYYKPWQAVYLRGV